MANYKERAVTGEVQDYRRSNKVIIVNELGGIPEVTFMEQDMTFLPDGRKLVTGSDKCSKAMLDPTVEFNLLNPETDEIIGTSTLMQVYVLLYSLYRHTADERDAAQQ